MKCKSECNFETDVEIVSEVLNGGARERVTLLLKKSVLNEVEECR